MVLFVPAFVSVASNCTNLYNGSTPTCTVPATNALPTLSLVGIGVAFIGGIFNLVAWIGALVRSARMQTWVWFIVVLLFSSLATLIYALAAPSDVPAIAYQQQPYQQQPYQQQPYQQSGSDYPPRV